MLDKKLENLGVMFGREYDLINGVLTLPGIAAMLLGIGMSVDANVIIFERLKEERMALLEKAAMRFDCKEKIADFMKNNPQTELPTATVSFPRKI